MRSIFYATTPGRRTRHDPDRGSLVQTVPELAPSSHNHLAEEIERLKTEAVWHDGDLNAIMLTKRVGLRLVLIVLRQGAVLREHHAPTAVTLHVICGRITVCMGGRSLELGPGEVVTMEPGVTHAGEAREDTALLLTLAEDVSK